MTDRTSYRDEKGKPIHLSNPRAGDTAFVPSVYDPSGEIADLSVRLGPRTVGELKRRYPETGRVQH